MEGEEDFKQPKSKNYYFILAGIIFVVIALIIAFVASGIRASPKEGLEDCQVLHYNGEDKINIVFFGDKAETDKYENYLMNIYPLSDYKESFNTYYIDYQPTCSIYKDVALFCHSKELLQKAASCPHDLVIVLQESQYAIRSSAYKEVISINTAPNQLTLLAHEFGHAFANFAEEYNSGASPPLGSKNCKSECTQFGEGADGCFDECSTSALHRSVDAGIMRTLSPANKDNMYGMFNAKIIVDLIKKRVPSTSITGNAVRDSKIEVCKDQRYVLYDLSETKSEIHPGCAGNGYGASSFVVSSGAESETYEFNADLFTDAASEEIADLNGETFSDLYSETLITVPETVVTEQSNLVVYNSQGQQISQTSLADAGAYPCEI